MRLYLSPNMILEIWKPRRIKLQEWSEICIFVRYSLGFKHYKFYNFKTIKMAISGDVMFYEKVLGID